MTRVSLYRTVGSSCIGHRLYTPMLIGEGTAMTTSQPQDTYSRLEALL